jgi:hypothetical protein
MVTIGGNSRLGYNVYRSAVSMIDLDIFQFHTGIPVVLIAGA